MHCKRTVAQRIVKGCDRRRRTGTIPWRLPPSIGPTKLVDTKPTGNSPFVVGVSGHRDLAPEGVAVLREAVKSFVQEIRGHLPHTDLQILTGMARGADLLVAQVALELGLHVEAVLPMSLSQYAADFDPQSLAVLHELLHHPNVRCQELAPPVMPAHAGAMPATLRDALYSNLTETLIRRSSLLLAIWDGQQSHLAGGTADTVLRFLGIRTEETPSEEKLTFVEATADVDSADRLVYWIPAARRDDQPLAESHPGGFLEGAGDNVLHVHRRMPAQLAAQLAEVDHYNRDYQQRHAAGHLGEHDSLIAGLPPEVPEPERAALRFIDTQYAKADALAIYYQRHSDRLFGLFGVMTFAMGLSYLIYERLTESRVLLVAYLVVLLGSLALYYMFAGKHWFAKHLTYRALAETLRIKLYLRLARVDHRVDAGEVLALSGVDRFRGFSWVSYVLKAVTASDPPVHAQRHATSRHTHWVEQAWIENQHRYFTRKVKTLARTSYRVKLLKQTLFVAVLLAITTLFLTGERLHEVHLRWGASVHNLLMFSMGFFAVLLGVWELHQDKMATQELLWQYRNQLHHFTRAKQLLRQMTSASRREDVLVALGRDSLMESYLWTIHRYHREHEPPTGG